MLLSKHCERSYHDVEEEQLFCGKILRREVKIVVKLKEGKN